MNRLVRSLMGPSICAGVLVSGYLLAAAAPVTPGLEANRAKSQERSAAAAAATMASRAAPQAKPVTTLVSARPPVPLLVTRHTSFFVEETQPAPATTTATAEAVVAGPQDKTDSSAPNASALSAKAMIEADGYKNVFGLVKAPDGTWAGMALRGATQVAVRVDASGSVSQQ
jgi:hypothetical protein